MLAFLCSALPDTAEDPRWAMAGGDEGWEGRLGDTTGPRISREMEGTQAGNRSVAAGLRGCLCRSEERRGTEAACDKTPSGDGESRPERST